MWNSTTGFKKDNDFFKQKNLWVVHQNWLETKINKMKEIIFSLREFLLIYDNPIVLYEQ